MTTEESRLFADLRAMWQHADPPSAGLAERMIAVVAMGDLDEELELLTLLHDSAEVPRADVRGLATARVLYFRAVRGWSLEAEIDGNRVSGQLLDFDDDPRSVEVVVETATGDSWSTGLDEVGFFTLEAALTDRIRFAVRHDGVSATSAWVDL